MQRTFAHAKVTLYKPTEERTQRAQAAVAELPEQGLGMAQKDMISHILENQQDDLQYFKAVYATCGFNLNDDVFVNEEFWNARKSPVLKPANWQHKDKDILGVIYAVEAQYLDGTPIDMESEKVPEDDFELVVHGVVYKYTFPDYADEIQKRSEAGDLYVSMETWFSDYAYALLNDEDVMAVVERTDATKTLDKSLRCLGGTGQYNGKRIGRVLKGLTFGGMGFVDQPANPRSEGLTFASEDLETPQPNKMEKPIMHDKEVVQEAVKAELNERAQAERLESLESTVASLEAEKATASENAERAASKAKDAELALALIGEALDTAIAGLGDNPPAEIARIDESEDKFAAKIAFLGETAKASSDEAVNAELEELRKFKADVEAAQAEAAKAELAEARKADVQEILGEEADEESVTKILAGLVDLDEEAYAATIETYRVLAGKSKPTIEKDGGQGSVESEGAAGESIVKSAPREDRKINVAASLEDAEVEAAVEPTGGEEEVSSPFEGLDTLVNKNKE